MTQPAVRGSGNARRAASRGHARFASRGHARFASRGDARFASRGDARFASRGDARLAVRGHARFAVPALARFASRVRARCATRALTLCATLALLATGGQPAAAQGTASVSETRETLSRWVETRKAISREREDWELGREVLESRIALLESERKGLRERLEEAREGLGSADAEQADVARRHDELDRATQSLDELILALEERTRGLLEAFPVPLVERVRPLARRIPDKGEPSELPLATRFQSVVGIMNEADKFARDVIVTSEVRELEGGESAEVSVLYLGLGQAWFVNAGGDVAGVGIPALDGWRWQERADLAPDVALAIDVLEDDAVPTWVPLPVEMTE